MKRWYTFIFADGFTIQCAGMSSMELKAQEQKHGMLLQKRPI